MMQDKVLYISYFLFYFLIQNSMVYCSPVDVNSGGTGLSSTTAYAIMTTGTSNSAPLQQITNLGTSGQVLTQTRTSNLPSFQNNNYGMIYLQTLTASGSASLAFTSSDFSSSYNVFFIELDNLKPKAASDTLQAFFSVNNGTSYLTTNYLSGINIFTYNLATVTNTNSTTFIPVSGITSSYVSGFLYFFPRIANFASGNSRFSLLTGQVISGYSGAMGLVIGYNTDLSATAVPVNNIKFQFASDVIAQGSIRLYGFKAS